MDSLVDSIKEDLKSAMLSKNNFLRDTLRLVTSEIKRFEVDNRKNPSVEEVSFFDDSGANTDEMVRFLSTYERKSGSQIHFDVAKVESDGKLTRMPGYRARRRNA